MRIGFLIYGDLKQCTGGYIYDRYLITHLQSKGHAVELISLPDKFKLQKITCNLSPSLIREIRRLNPDILVQDALCLPSLIGLNRILSICFTFPKIALVHQLVYLRRQGISGRPFYYALERSYLKSTDAIIVNSKRVQDSIRNELGVRRPGLVARPGGNRLGPGCNREQIRRKSYEKGPLNLFFLGNILPNKGLHTLIMVLKDLDPEIWNISAAGSLEMDTAYSGYIKKIIADYNLSSKVRLLGQLDREKVKKEMETQHILALPYSIEGFGIAYLEGMSMGLPAVGSTKGAAREVITHGRNGFLVDFPGGEDLRGYLTRLYRHRNELRDMSAAALDTFVNFPTWEQSMEKVRLFMEELREN